MLDVSILFWTLLTAVASLAAIIMFGTGVCALLGGRVTLCSERLRGRAARIAGMMMAAVLPLFLIMLAVFGAPRGVDWRTSSARYLLPILAMFLVLAGIVSVLRYATRARSRA